MEEKIYEIKKIVKEQIELVILKEYELTELPEYLIEKIDQLVDASVEDKDNKDEIKKELSEMLLGLEKEPEKEIETIEEEKIQEISEEERIEKKEIKKFDDKKEKSILFIFIPTIIIFIILLINYFF